MPIPSAQRAYHGQLIVNTVFEVELTAESSSVEVLNRTGGNEIYWTVSSSNEEPADPTMGGQDCFVTPAMIGSYIAETGDAPIFVKLISDGAMKFSVIAGQPS